MLRVGGLAHVLDVRPGHAEGARARRSRAPTAHTHTNRFVDMHDLGDMLVAGGLRRSGDGHGAADADVCRTRATLLAELKALGATNATRGRPRGLDGRGALAARCSTRRSSGCARGRPHSGDVRSHLRPRLEGRADARRPKACRSSSSQRPRVRDAPDAELLSSRDRYGRRQDATSRTALLRAHVAAGRRAVGMKPVAAGIADGAAVNADVAALAAAGKRRKRRSPTAIRTRSASAGGAASRGGRGRRRRSISTDRSGVCAASPARADVVVVEGAGGVLVPLGGHERHAGHCVAACACRVAARGRDAPRLPQPRAALRPGSYARAA